MFDKETLQHIEAQALIAAAKPISIDGGASVAVMPRDVVLVKLEQYQPLRDRFRGNLKTHSIQAFCNYVEGHDGNNIAASLARGFVDQDQMAATIIFNLGDQDTAGHGDDTATLILKPTAAYSALQAIAGKTLSQQQLAEWLEDWGHHIQAVAGDESIGLPMAIVGIRKMTIKQTSQRDSTVGDFSASRSSMDDIEAKSMEILPTAFVFTTEPFEGLNPASIYLRMSVITGKEEPQLKLRWVGEESQREDIARQFKNALEMEIGGLVPLTLGTFNLSN